MSRGGRRTETSLIADPNFLERLIKKIENNKINSINTELMSNRLPIHFGGMSDPIERKMDQTSRLCEYRDAFLHNQQSVGCDWKYIVH